MGMLDRFADIIKANVNDLLDRAEDPAKMVDQYLRDLAESLAEVKEETAGVMAEEARTARMVSENNKEVEKYDGLARRALQAGNEGDARTFLAKKQQLEAQGEQEHLEEVLNTPLETFGDAKLDDLEEKYRSPSNDD